ncbi:MAG: glutathione synthase [Gammaproteobacteria bacterium]|nr:glutathione synthase [Gammaproteobacteria bacterium]MCW9004151.1 glutathione synthase [Gammaproteobacteria bacterium]MCW9056615.1 glutathione synthase [Gammaproteobacteria bacterium]
MATHNIKLGIIMDPIESINIKKDSSFAMLLAAQRKNWQIFYIKQSEIFQQDKHVFANSQALQVKDHQQNWFTTDQTQVINLADLDVILMRKDPPFDMEYIYTTYLLEHVEKSGTLVINKPASLRDANEKLFATQFPQCCTSTLVTRHPGKLRDFINEHKDVILKPLDGMGGESIFRVTPKDPNLSVIIETMTRHNSKTIMAQKYIPEITDGDKRILLINGEAVPYSLARIPAEGETRGNLAAGGQGVGMPLTDREKWICQQVGPRLKEMGLIFVGIDVIGDYLTEINVTSPTCIRELDSQFNLDIGMQLMDCIESLRS